MGFTAALALALGALVVLPWIAHRLRRSPPRDEPFAPLRFVPDASGPSDVPRGIDDRSLFGVRALVVLLLALLAAGPRLESSTLGVRQGDGDASVVLVLDDSGSMRAREGASARLALAKAELRRVLDDLDGGDRAALVLAGKPARVARGFTEDLQAIRAAIEGAEAGDRATDLAGALDRAQELAGEERGAVVVVATDGEGSGGPRTIETKLPLHVASVTAARRDDCAAIAAHAREGSVHVRVACQAASKRRVRWLDGEREIAATQADLREGVTEIALDAAGERPRGRVELDAADGLAADDAAAIVVGGARMRIGVVDRSVGVDDEERTPPTLLRAFEAVAPEAEIERLARVPTDAALASLDVLAIDHAVPWSADERVALQGAMESGLSLWVAFGPASAEGSLGASFEPFVEGPVRWEPGASRVRFGGEGAAPAQGRARFVLGPGAQVVAAFEDDVPFLVRASHRGGAVTLVAVPSDPRFGDAALRPAYVDAALAIVDEARRLRPHGDLRAGETLPVPADAEVIGPRGRIEVDRSGAQAEVELAHAGELRIRDRGSEQVRVVTLDEAEVLGGAVAIQSSAAPLERAPQLRDRSGWVAALLLAALVAELALRYGLRGRRASSP